MATIETFHNGTVLQSTSSHQQLNAVPTDHHLIVASQFTEKQNSVWYHLVQTYTQHITESFRIRGSPTRVCKFQFWEIL